MEKAVEIREAKLEDCPAIRALIQDLADFEEMPEGPKIDQKILETDGFSTDNPLFKSYVAVCDNKIVGYALYFYIYYTPDKKVLHLEDLYVDPDYRRKSIGSRLFDTVAKRTFEEKCLHLDFSVLSWNPAQEFYKSKGSVDLTENDGWHMYRFTRENFKNFPANKSVSDKYIIREADLSDLDSIKRLAEENSPATEKISDKNFKEVSLKVSENDTDKKSFQHLVAELNKTVLGYALYCYAYSTWEGKSLYLQEFYVSSSEYESSIKNDLLSCLIQKAVYENCSRIDFWIQNHKTEGGFYTSKGATNLTEKEEWHLYRLSELQKRQST